MAGRAKSRFVTFVLTIALSAVMAASFGTALGQQESPSLRTVSSQTEGRQIRNIELHSDGPVRRIATSDIFKLILLEKGKPYAETDAKHTIERLYSTELFHDVQVETRPVGTTEVDVDVVLIRRYYVNEIRFDGKLEVDPAELRRELALRAGEPYSQQLMEETISRLQALYQRHGYYKPKIETEFDADHENARLTVGFDVQAGEQAQVAKLEFDIEGGFDPNKVASLMKTKNAMPYSQIQMDRDIAAIEKDFALRGYLNPDIYLRGGAVYDSGTNRVSLVLRIVPREHTEIIIEGIEPDSSMVKNLPLFSQQGSALAFMEESMEELRTALQEQGHLLAGVSYDISGTEEERKITVRVDKGKKYSVDNPIFQGNSSIPSSRLETVLRTRKAVFLRSGAFSQETLHQDVERLQSFYQQRGFVDAKATFSLRGDFPRPGRLAVVYAINEGVQYTVRKLEITGNREISEATLRRDVLTREGQPFSAIQVAQDRANILATYESLGYRDTDLDYEIAHPEPPQVDIRYVIQEGPKRFVENVIMAGMIQTKPSAIQNELAIEARGPLSLDRIFATETNLYDLGVFNQVDVKEAPSYYDPNLKNVIIRVEEAKEYNILYGIGYSSYEGVRGTFGVSDSNFVGMARTLSFGMRAGRQRQRANLSYTVGRVFGWKLPTVATAAIDNEKALTEQSVSRRVIRGRPFDALRLIGSMQSERRLSARESFFIRLNFQNVRIKLPENLATPLQFFREEERLRLSSTSIAYLNESRDDPVNPSSGFFLSGEALVSAKAIGSQRQFFRILTQGQYYKEVYPRLVVATSLRLGAILPFGNKPNPNVENPVPISERFFSGGSTTLRGLPQDLAGPLLRDPKTGEIVLVDFNGQPDPKNGRPVPLGGNGLIIGNVELRFPLVSFLSGAVFLDTGNVFRSLTDLSQAGFSNAVGFGLRANTPVGPVRVDVGYNPNPPIQVGFKNWNLHFTLGHPF